jgi:hypothetical protein
VDESVSLSRARQQRADGGVFLNATRSFKLSAAFLGFVSLTASASQAQLSAVTPQPATTDAAAADFSTSRFSRSIAAPLSASAIQPDFQPNLQPEGQPDPQPAVTDSLFAPLLITGTAVNSDSDWHLTVSPYLWFPGVHGGIGIGGRETSIHVSAGDLLSHFRFGLMGVIEPRYKRIVMPLDIVWVRLGDDRALSNIASVANLKGDEFILTQKVGYRVIDTERIKIDGLAGFRYWHYGTNVSFTTNSLNYSGSQNWVDPLVGGRITGILTPKIEITVAGDVGGWGVGSQLAYQAVGLLGYRIKPALTLQAGYRYLATNYQTSNGFVDMVESGVMFGVSINFK